MNTWTYRFLYAAGTVTGLVGVAAVVYYRPKSKATFAASTAAFGLLAAYSAYKTQQEARTVLSDVSNSVSALLGVSPRQRVVEKAESMIGLTEISPEIREIILGYQEHKKWAERNPTADWCVMWATWVVRYVTGNAIPWMGSVSTDLAPVAAASQALPGDRVGAIAYRDKHAAIVVAEDANGRITTIDGNASNQVLRIGPSAPSVWTGYWKWW